MPCRCGTASATAPSWTPRQGSRCQLGAVAHKVVDVDLRAIGGSALTDDAIAVPTGGLTNSIPSTYVPARNTILLALALGYAEVVDARDIFYGANAVDCSGYPDCRPAFVAAFQQLANVATKAGVEGRGIEVHAPIIEWTKAEIIQRGQALGVDFSLTVSCYQANGDGRACGVCDSCRIRRNRFRHRRRSGSDALCSRHRESRKNRPLSLFIGTFDVDTRRGRPLECALFFLRVVSSAGRAADF